MPLISQDNIFALVAIIFGLSFLGFWADKHSLARKIPGVVWVLAAGILLSNTGVIPLKASTYDFVGGYIMPLGVPLLLYRANIRQVFRESGMVLPIFLLASITTAIGAVVGFYLFDLGEIGPKIAGVYGGTFIGGMVNFVAIAEVAELTTTEFGTILSPSAPVSIIALMALIVIPSIHWIAGKYSLKDHGQSELQEQQTGEPDPRPEFRLRQTTAALGLSAIICAVGTGLADSLGISNYSLFLITLITVTLANIIPNQLSRLTGDFELGMVCMYLFFAVIGAGTNATEFAESAFTYFCFGLFIIAFHITATLVLARIFKFDLAETVVASGAALVGAAATAGIASSKGWKNLITPAITTGMLGYVIANFVGVAILNFLS
ncbi:MAG: DUF819 domain-containing protein [Kordiimonas sp.]